MPNNYKFEHDEIVAYDNGVLCGIGQIKGVCGTELPVIGVMYILKDLSHALPTKEYPFDHFACAECHMKKADKEEHHV